MGERHFTLFGSGSMLTGQEVKRHFKCWESPVSAPGQEGGPTGGPWGLPWTRRQGVHATYICFMGVDTDTQTQMCL